MIAIHAHFDGKVTIPDEPVDLPQDQTLIVRIEPIGQAGAAEGESALDWLAENAVDSTVLPADLSREHDHYLYGRPKKDA